MDVRPPSRVVMKDEYGQRHQNLGHPISDSRRNRDTSESSSVRDDDFHERLIEARWVLQEGP